MIAALFLHGDRRHVVGANMAKNSDTIKKVAKLMRNLDFCMLTTHATRGGLHARPMSNNGEVEFDGDVWFFSEANSRKVREIEAEPTVHLSYVDLDDWRFVSLSGNAEIVRDARKKHELWLEDLKQWFDEGPESDGIVLIKVTPSVVSYWTKDDEGELRISEASHQ
jgi:general stress protein 26